LVGHVDRLFQQNRPWVILSPNGSFQNTTVDARRLRELTVAIYHYVIPLIFASVGAIGAYYLFIA
jgi:hypothetical protein